MQRRDFLGTCAAIGSVLATSSAHADTPLSPDLLISELRLNGSANLARRSLLIRPKLGREDQKFPLLILLHGLGETGNERLGTHAWGERYGLVRAYERLLHPPITREFQRQSYLTNTHMTELNSEMASRPLSGLVIACPVTPNPWKLNGSQTIDQYATWLENDLIPSVKTQVGILEGRDHLGIDGCSLGGYLSFEVFLRKPQLFGCVGGVQAAIGAGTALAQRISNAIGQAGESSVHVETSTGDPYRRANEELARSLSQRGIPVDLSVLPGPHDQIWLREIGTMEMLLWHDRKLNNGLFLKP